MYGYQEEVKSSHKHFGLNEKVRMTKFEWINNAGKGGSEGEALDIQFTFDGDEKPVSYRQFPVNRVRDWKSGVDITDDKDPMMIKARQEWSANITSLVKCFVDEEELKEKTQKPFESFKEYCKALVSALPKDFDTVDLDLFMQWQWKLKDDQDTTFLEIPKNGKGGVFVCRHRKPVGKWEAATSPNGSLIYRDGENTLHPFCRDSKWMDSNYANRQERESIQELSTETVASSSNTTANADW